MGKKYMEVLLQQCAKVYKHVAGVMRTAIQFYYLDKKYKWILYMLFCAQMLGVTQLNMQIQI